MRCGCENGACTEPHRLGACPSDATVECMWVGGLCGPCAEHMPATYLGGPIEPDKSDKGEPTDEEKIAYLREAIPRMYQTWVEAGANHHHAVRELAELLEKKANG